MGCFIRVYTANSMVLDKLHFNAFLSPTQTFPNVSIFQTFPESSVYSCVMECKLTRTCRFINYDVRSRKCELLRADDDNVDVNRRNGYVVGKKSDWDLVRKK